MNFMFCYPDQEMQNIHINNILYIVSRDDEISHPPRIQETPTNLGNP